MNKLNYEVISLIMDFADYSAPIKKYFRKNVLPEIDRTIAFVRNPECPSCFKQACGAKSEQRFGAGKAPDFKFECFACMRIEGEDRIVSAHSSSQNWRRSYKVLTNVGFDAWLEACYQPRKCNLFSSDTVGMRACILAAFYNRWNEDIHERAVHLVSKNDWHGVRMSFDERMSTHPGLFQ